MSEPEQSFENHAKMVPLYHYWATGLLVVPTLYFAYQTVTSFSVEHLMTLLFAIGVLLAGFFTRVFPLGVQDRLIRLEERLRMERLLPEELKRRIEEISTEHLVGLRFASDEELADLVRRVLDGELRDRKEVKASIRSWRADYQRI
ncbi:MAG: DUF6526 family protein [Longimicrobiales bacterium]|nr:DUF6526 family protein [Longimicrobiales bacterium]